MTVRFNSLIFIVGVAVVVSSLCISNSRAAIINVSGTGVDAGSAAVVDLDNGGAENNMIQGYEELEEVAVGPNSVIVDRLVGDNLNIGDPFQGFTNFNAANGRFLPTGLYNSHLIHFDPVGTSGGISGPATFTFKGSIVGIIISNAGDDKLLNDSDPIFGNALDYDTAQQRRFDGGGGLDIVTLLAANVLRIDQAMTGSSHIDNARVLTIPVPEPMSAGLLTLGAAGLAMRRRR